ncbi:hypothetical protein V6N13_023148 [Hibiscus sabdariffa]|uniref:Uncharacterized protein n=2 Tax=Hibiscus sabdariffa TaxID=183260 RepID=A0ABR2NWW1_9ROSI
MGSFFGTIQLRHRCTGGMRLLAPGCVMRMVLTKALIGENLFPKEKFMVHPGGSGKTFLGPLASLSMGFGQPNEFLGHTFDTHMDLGEESPLVIHHDGLKRPRQHSAISGIKDSNESSDIPPAGLGQQASRNQ